MAGKVLGQRRAVPPEVEADGPEGDEARQRIGQAAYDLNVQQYCCGGLNFGYFYDRSPIIAHDDAPPPAYTMADFTPSTVPGCRLPFSRLADGRPITDALGPGYTLLRRDPSINVDALIAPLHRAGAPIEVIDIAADAVALYDHALLLVRTDQHIAWRGNVVPADAEALIDQLLGRKVKLAQAA